MTIAICDDDVAILQETQKIVSNYMQDGDCTVVDFDTPMDLLSFAKNNDIDLVFMDIELGPKSGIEVVKELQIMQPDCQAVYYTNYIQYATDVYETNHCWYVLKGQLEQRLPDIIHKVEEKLNRKTEILIVRENGTNRIVEAQQIMYIERSYKVSYIHTVGGIVEAGEKLDELFAKLNPTYFVRCHKSFIVNFFFVKQYARMELQMKNGESIPISRQNIVSVRDAFLNWGRLQR